MPEITVPVPDARTAEFYQFFGLWLAGSLSLTPHLAEAAQTPREASGAGGASGASGSPAAPKPITPWTGGEEDVADAEALWAKFSPNARGMFGLLADNPDTKYSGTQIAEAANIPHGAHGVAGVLAWPGRFCGPMGRELPTRWEEDVEAGDSYYWMTAPVAALFQAARKEVENTG
ncbi:DUF6416 domain-containing protein [Lapillicoccus sp.]|uniref:DUF6416 domain-containing protein n=1 Tax=Lapillicoccus sp. TaxID=1909287 RepID=UPI0025E3F452|nr:DUF6416 domain-containing protein [Lapillicoccus sp.]